MRYVRAGGIVSGLVLLLALLFRNGALMCGALCVQGVAFGALIPCMLDLSCREVPESSMLATTAMGLSLYVAQIIAPPLIGALETAFSLHVGIALCGAFMILTSVCCLVAPLGDRRPSEERTDMETRRRPSTGPGCFPCMPARLRKAICRAKSVQTIRMRSI